MNIKFRQFMLALALTFVSVSLSACAIGDAVNRRGGDVTRASA